MPRWASPPPGDKPLASASRNLRQLARERKNEAALKRDAEAFAAGQPVPDPPTPSPTEYVAAMRASLSAHERKLAAARALFERVVGQCSIPSLDRLIGALEMFEHGLRRRAGSKD
jgi:hypothetical protein